MKRIGITIVIQGSVFSNGAQQNAIFLAKVLKKCGYVVDLICADEKTEIISKLFCDSCNTILIKNSLETKYDLIIGVGVGLDIEYTRYWSLVNREIKFVNYKVGSQIFGNMENSIFNLKEDSNFFEMSKYNQSPHQIWTLPHHEKTNRLFYQFYHNQEKITVVPFIWEPNIIEKNMNIYLNRPLERVCVMEPNFSVIKNAFLPILILEKNQTFNKLNQVLIFNCDKIKTHSGFIDFVKNTNIYKSGILSIESCFSTPVILGNHADFVLSWQWENNLNYLWLDCAWMGYPVIHNGSLCKDVGYYYEGFDGDEAIEKIGLVINTHNQNHEEYLVRNREIIKRYTSENQKLIDQYRELVEDVLNNKFSKRTYDWKENSVK